MILALLRDVWMQLTSIINSLWIKDYNTDLNFGIFLSTVWKFFGPVIVNIFHIFISIWKNLGGLKSCFTHKFICQFDPQLLPADVPPPCPPIGASVLLEMHSIEWTGYLWSLYFLTYTVSLVINKCFGLALSLSK